VPGGSSTPSSEIMKVGESTAVLYCSIRVSEVGRGGVARRRFTWVTVSTSMVLRPCFCWAFRHWKLEAAPSPLRVVLIAAPFLHSQPPSPALAPPAAPAVLVALPGLGHARGRLLCLQDHAAPAQPRHLCCHCRAQGQTHVQQSTTQHGAPPAQCKSAVQCTTVSCSTCTVDLSTVQ